ncbi:MULTISPECIES: DNA polymerase III subunit chi [Sphingomonas]|uniref:DNA polymerase III subunit chi n=1 Tax=Sphingomonas TaxID=13687 RepID=UPI00193B6E8A|nr:MULTISPECIES: DNA polymerase III subunit chi [Sphingomonas]
MQVDFYHLTTTPLDRALPQIAEKVVASGARLLIVAEDPEQRAQLDRLLWIYDPESFLPHAQAGGGGDALQPVLIAGSVDAANGARHVAIVDGRWRDEALTFERAFHFFGEDHIQAARTAWRGLGDAADVERRYWKQSDTGRWERAA